MKAGPWVQPSLPGVPFRPEPTPEARRVAEALRRLGLHRELEHEIVDADGNRVGWGDVFIPILGLVVEVDGHQHRTDSGQVWRDSYKTAVANERGLHVVRVPNRDAAHLSYFALCQRLKAVVMPYVQLRGLTWTRALMNGQLYRTPANDNK